MAEESSKKPTRRTERIGKYEILDHIATGGMGVVYKARDADLDRLVALKILPMEMAKQPLTLERFKREAKAAAQLRHENIVSIFDVGEVSGTHFIALEFIAGTDLQDYINRKCKLNSDEARQIIIQAVRALAHAHEKGIVHRDIKPSNFLLTQKDNRLIVKLTDFGLAIRHENEEEFRITKDRTTVGTIDYMSPEQARNSRAVDIRSDIYSLGCTFFHMLAGVAPFARGTLPERILQHMQSARPDVRQHNKSVPAYLATIIHRMLARKPDDRYQSPAELLHDLEHPDLVPVTDNESQPSSKLDRRPAQKRKEDPTQVVDTESIETEAPKRRPTRNPPPKTPSKPDDVDVDAPEDEYDPSGDVDAPEDKTAPSDDVRPAVKPKGASSGGAAGNPVWMYVAGGTVGVLGLVLIGALLFGGKPPSIAKSDPTPPKRTEPDIVEKEDPKKEDKTPGSTVNTSAALMNAGVIPLPTMDTTPDKADRVGLRNEFSGPFTEFPQVPPNAAVWRVRRLAEPGPKTFRTLADAFAALKPGQFTVIEIHDNGPLFIPVLPELDQCQVIIRAGSTYRPMLVWDVPTGFSKEKPPTTFAKFTQGKLVLEGLDLAMRWNDGGPATVFDLSGSDFYSRECTFSIAGKSSQGISLLRRQTVKGSPSANRVTQTWLQRCYVRGADMVLCDSDSTPGALFLDESLIAGYTHPLFRLRGRNQDAFSLFSVRSTLVTGHAMFHWQSLPAKGSAAIQAKILDSILSRDDAVGKESMIDLADVGDLSKMAWRVENSVYSGWHQLLASGPKSIAGEDLDAWRRQWFHVAGDRSLGGAWPPSPPRPLENEPAESFRPADSPIAFAALTGSGAIGCVVGRLPPAPDAWLARHLDAREFLNIAHVEANVPEIPKASDDRYHGERIDELHRVDLGAHLAKVLQDTSKPPAPKVVLHLKGRGACPTSPIRIKGIQHLVLVFEQGKDPKDAISLEANSVGISQRAPLIEMTGGHLEVIGARVQLSPVTLVPNVFKLQNTSLTLTRCWLQGPLDKAPANFQSLVAMSNPEPAPITLLMRENVLVTGKLIVDLQDNIQLQARQNLFVSLGDALSFEIRQPTIARTHMLDHNTFAVRHAVFGIPSAIDPQVMDDVVVQSRSNAYLSPFGDGSEKPVLCRGIEALAANGTWTWQGRYNVYSGKLHSYGAGLDRQVATRQSLRDWQLVWGRNGDLHAELYDAGPLTKPLAIEAASPAILLIQLERLALPKQFRGDPTATPPGADLNLILKKKG